MLPRLRAIFARMMPALAKARNDEVKVAMFLSELSSFCRGIMLYMSDPGVSPHLRVRKEDFAAIMECAFRTVLTFWPSHWGLQEPVFNALVAMAPLLAPDALRKNIPRLIAIAVHLYEDGYRGDTVSKNVHQIVMLALESGYTLLNASMDDLLSILHREISARQESQLPVDNHGKVLCSLTLLTNAFPLMVANFITAQLKSSSGPSRTASRLMLTHLFTAGKAKSYNHSELLDNQPCFSQRSSSIFCLRLGATAFELKEQVPEILGALQPCLPLMDNTQLRVIVSLAFQHPEQVAETLLSWALPMDSSWCNLWRALGAEGHLSRRLLRFLMGTMSASLPRDPAEDCVTAAHRTLTVTCAMRELLFVPEGAGAFQRVFPQLFGALLLQMGRSEKILQSTQEADTPSQRLPGAESVCRDTVLAMLALLLQAQLKKVTRQMVQGAGCAKLQSPESCTEGICLLARAMAQHAGPLLPGIMEVLVPFLSTDRELDRVTVTAFFSELLCDSEKQLRAMLLKILIPRVQDPSVRVRAQLFQGVGRTTASQVQGHGRELLAILGSDLKDTDLTGRQAVLAALSALSNVLPHLRQDSISQDVIGDILKKVTLLLENDDEELRCVGATVLGDLCQCQAVTARIKQELQGVQVRLLLHLRDPSPEMAQACLLSLVYSGSTLKLDTFSSTRIEDEGELIYHCLLDDLAAFLASDFPEALGGSFSCAKDCLNSKFPEVRSSATMFIGFLFEHASESILRSRWIKEILQGLKRVLQEDPNAQTRSCAAQALGHWTAFQDRLQQIKDRKPRWKRVFCCRP